jgi:small subunit ribosomal protein S18
MSDPSTPDDSLGFGDDRPPQRDDDFGRPRSDDDFGRPRSDDGGFRGRGDGPRGRRDDRPRPPQTVKARLRAKARKKARKQKKMFQRRKVCRFCADKKLAIDYKEPKTLRLFLTETGKLIPRRISGNCAKHQRPLALAVKRARQVALLPYSTSHV